MEENKEKIKVVIVEDDQSIKEGFVHEHEIPSLLGSGFVSAILKINNNEIEYADDQYSDIEKAIIIWKKPEKLED